MKTTTAPMDTCPKCCEGPHQPWRSWIAEPKPPKGGITYLRSIVGDYRCALCGHAWWTGWALDYL